MQQPPSYRVLQGQSRLNLTSLSVAIMLSAASVTGGACTKYASSEAAAAAVVKVLGDTSLRTCKDAAQCTSGDGTEQAGSTVAGTGFAPMLEEATKDNNEQLARLVNGVEKPTAANLAKLKTGSLGVTAGVIRALQRDPDNAALVARLASELARADTIETAFIMRRMISTGMSEPNAAALKSATGEGTRRIEALDREITALKNEMEMKREISRNAVLTIIERENNRADMNPQRQATDNADARFNQLAVPEGDK